MLPFTQSPAHRLRSAYLRMHRVTNRAFHPFGMTADQYVLLRLLCEGDGISQQELGRQSASDPTTIGRMLELLERKGFIRRDSAERDRRTRLVFITRSGRAITRKLYTAAQPVREALSQTLPSRAMERLLDGLAQMNEALEQMQEGDKRLEVPTRK